MRMRFICVTNPKSAHPSEAESAFSAHICPPRREAAATGGTIGFTALICALHLALTVRCGRDRAPFLKLCTACAAELCALCRAAPCRAVDAEISFARGSPLHHPVTAQAQTRGWSSITSRFSAGFLCSSGKSPLFTLSLFSLRLRRRAARWRGFLTDRRLPDILRSFTRRRLSTETLKQHPKTWWSLMTTCSLFTRPSPRRSDWD